MLVLRIAGRLQTTSPVQFFTRLLRFLALVKPRWWTESGIVVLMGGSKIEAVVFGACVAMSLSGCGGGGNNPPQIVAAPPPAPDEITFVEIAAQAGLTRMFSIVAPLQSMPEAFGGGIAAVDYDADGDIDLYVVGGDGEPNHLYQNQGDGSFVDVAPSVGLDMQHLGSGPTFADIDGDGDLDLFVGAIENDSFFLMENQNGLFVDVTSQSGIVLTVSNTISATFFDYDLDGDLDLFLSHWGANQQADTETVWQSNGDGTFVSASIQSGIAPVLIEPVGQANLMVDRTFTPNFSDIDGDGDGDLLMAADFGASQVFINNGDGTFTKTTDRSVIVDQAGMGAATGDYDNDGDMDWFVSSIFDESPTEAYIGNRLYRNDGTGTFEDVTDMAGVADGGWGWGSCFADFDNDGNLDIFHVNGWQGGKGATLNDYTVDQIRFFHSQGDGTFVEAATAAGLTDVELARGVACFDADRDGDIDIVLTNNDQNHLVYYRNDSSNSNHYLGVTLENSGANGYGIGALVTVTTTLGTQIREVHAGNNFTSQNPLEVHFGLSTATTASVVVRWPDGAETTMSSVAVDQLLKVLR